jgi:hypothetical protein
MLVLYPLWVISGSAFFMLGIPAFLEAKEKLYALA